MSSPVQTERPISFRSRGRLPLALEGVIHTPMRVGNAPVIILCHPQPVSSNMDDTLTVMLARSIAATGMVALRFNFRGVGNSQGEQTDGSMEPLDLAGAIDIILTQYGVNPAKVGVIGHGFGAFVALLYAPFDPRIRTIIAISLPLFRTSGGFPRDFEGPKLFVIGEFDEVCPLYKLEPFVEQQKGPRGIKVITGAQHLMRGHEEAAIDTILKYLQKWAHMPGM